MVQVHNAPETLHFRVLLPVLVEKEEELLRAAQREDREQDLPALLQRRHHLRYSSDVRNNATQQLVLTVLALVVRGPAVGALRNDDVGVEGRDLGSRQMAIFFAREIAGVSTLTDGVYSLQDADVVDFDAEHGGSENMSSLETRDLDAVVPSLLVVVDGLNGVHAGLQLLRRVDAVRFALTRGEGQVVVQQALHDVARWVRHKDSGSLLSILSVVEETALYT